MNKKKRIILICILSILVVVLLTAFVFATINFASGKKAHAEYSDINQYSIVNFNQIANWYARSNEYYNYSNVGNGYYNIELTNSSITWARIFLYSSANIINSSHKYYIDYESNWGVRCQIWNGSSGNDGAQYLNSNDSIIVTGYNAYQFNIVDYFSSYPTGSINVKINMIDLSQMFGIGNEPNLAQAKELFTAEYYPYTTNQAMFFGLNQNDMFQNLVYEFNTGVISGYPQNITQSNVSYNSDGGLIFTAKHSDSYVPYWLINFKTKIPVGSIITINLDDYLTYSGVGFAICYADENEDYILSIPTNSSTHNAFHYSFVVSKEISSLYLIEQGSSTWSQGTILTINSGNINIQFSDDYQFNLQAQYDLGYSDAETYYTDGFGRQTIWGEGFDAGYTRGVSEGSLSDGWTFLSTMFTGIGTIFGLEIFPNITVGTFVMIPLLICLIFFIVKLSRGGS